MQTQARNSYVHRQRSVRLMENVYPKRVRIYPIPEEFQRNSKGNSFSQHSLAAPLTF